MKKYATRLEQILDQQGRKKSWLAVKCRRDNNTITNWIKGRTRPNDDEKVFIASLLGLSVQEIFFDQTMTHKDTG